MMATQWITGEGDAYTTFKRCTVTEEQRDILRAWVDSRPPLPRSLLTLLEDITTTLEEGRSLLLVPPREKV